MAEPWVSIIGIGEDGLDGLSVASRDALGLAEIVFGAPRHLALAQVGARGQEWPVPFSVDPVLERRGQQVAVLASGDPFWQGAGGSLCAQLHPGEWRAFPAPSTFSLAAARLGWRLEETHCIGLHAAPFARLRPHLSAGARAICLLRDGAAPALLAAWLTEQGFGASQLWVLEALGGPNETIRQAVASGFDLADVKAPVAMAVLVVGDSGLSRASGLADDLFVHSGQITKRPMRALTLSALAPRAGEMLWDIGAGSGSISVEWCLAGGHACAIETRPDRVAQVRANCAAFGLDGRLTIVEGAAPDALAGLPAPAAVFIGGGGTAALFGVVWPQLQPGTRLVANAVTLETEALLTGLQALHGGSLMRVDIAHVAPLGRMRGWQAERPVVQWSAVK